MDGREDASQPSWWAAPDDPPPVPEPGFRPPQNFGQSTGGPPPGGPPPGYPPDGPHDPWAVPPPAPQGGTAQYPQLGATSQYPAYPWAGDAPGGYPPPYPAGGPVPGGPPAPGRREELQVGGPEREGRGGRRRTVALIAGGLVAVLVLVGGGYLAARRFVDGRVPADWRDRTNAYCRQVDKDLKDAGRSPDGVTRLERTAKVIRTMDDHLRGLPVAAAQRADYDTMLERWDQLSTGYDAAVAAARRGDDAAATSALARAEQANEQGNAIANRIGLSDCAGAGGLPEPGGGGASPSPSGTVV